MITISYQLTAQERLILSRTGATAGLHECLDFVPGNVLLGAVAAEYYPKWRGCAERQDDLFDLFHSGAVSFGDAHPCDATGSPALPAPLSLHIQKPLPGKPSGHLEKVGQDDYRLVPDKVLNFAVADYPTDEQWQQLRAGWVGADGLLYKVHGGHVLKTARDSEMLGAPDEGRLFGYSYLEAGQTFGGSILVDEARSDLADLLRGWISGGREVHVGRSHRAEFGQCRLETVDGPQVDSKIGDSEQATGLLVLLAASDWWFPEGLPADGARFHHLLADYALVRSKTFARFRRYASWNSFRGYPDLERQVVAHGSVITLERKAGTAGSSLSDLRHQLNRDGIGMGRPEGLGRVVVNASLLAGTHPIFEQPRGVKNASTKRTSRPHSPYLGSIEERWTRNWVQVTADDLAGVLVEEWRSFRNPRPRKSQWAALRTLARKVMRVEDFTKEFRSYTQAGAAAYKWSGTSGGLGGDSTLADAILKSWENHNNTIGGKDDPRAKASGAKEKVFLAAVTEAARRLRG